MSQNMDKGRAVVNMVIKHGFWKIFWLAAKPFPYKVWFCSMGLDKSAGRSSDFRKWETT